MLNYLYEALCRYFEHLCNTGYMKQSEVDKLLVLTMVQRMVDCDFRGYLNEEDYEKIGDALYNLYGTSCLIPYPDYYSNKDRRIMYTCSISELAHRVAKLEEEGVSGGGFNPEQFDKLIIVPDDSDEIIEIDEPDIE